jgi:hypothetical protein
MRTNATTEAQINILRAAGAKGRSLISYFANILSSDKKRRDLEEEFENNRISEAHQDVLYQRR